ncbi:hypothetical protein ISS07_01690 [Candidatus Woesearchaeota archaeon]|nr:hypothetical protein [Candidatus Woesearchaeota archaeon]
MLKKAQGGTNAAVLIAVIAALILLYIVFLPDAEREALLENKTVDRSSDGDGTDVLLREFPERLDTVEEIEDKDIPNVLLFETTNAKELENINPFIVRKGWFDEKTKETEFAIENLDNTDNVILSFKAKEHKGTLTITLNNEIIYENDLESQTVAPITLKKNLLREENKLIFSVSPVGMKFWRTNEYSLEDVKVIGDITDKTKQESKNVFTLTSTDLFNIEEANLRFVPYCGNVEDVGTLDITLNSRNLFSAVPVCEDAYKQAIPLGMLNSGENNIVLRTNKGSYSVEQIRVTFKEEDVKTNVYFFEINDTTLEDIESGAEDVILKMEFVEDNDLKRADININDRFITLDVDERTFSKDITDYIKEGNNFIEIRPRTRLDIVELTVELEE